MIGRAGQSLEPIFRAIADTGARTMIFALPRRTLRSKTAMPRIALYRSAIACGGILVVACGSGAHETASDGGGAATAEEVSRSCSSLPPVADYGAPGPFDDVKMFTGVG